MQKSLREISLPITEEEYRADGCMHYSTLAKFARCGFHGLSTLFDRIETPSLTNGSAVDSIITGGQSEFEERFMVAEIPSLSDNMLKIVKHLFDNCKENFDSIDKIPVETRVAVWDMFDGRKWQPKTKADKIVEEGSEYYKLLFIAEGKTILSTEAYNTVLAQVEALKESDATNWYFRDDMPADASGIPFDGIERLYQLKFRTSKDGIDYSCMMDLVVVDHNAKIIYPVDLKTSSHYEDEFFKSFIDWDYQIQARSYSRSLRDTIMKDEYFKDFTIADYRFIVVNKKTLTPLVWLFRDTHTTGTLTYGANGQYVLRDPYDIAKELKDYLDNPTRVQQGINLTADNDIINWLNKV